MKKLLPYLLVALIAGPGGFLAYRLLSTSTSTTPPPDGPPALAPELEMATLDGGRLALSDLRGKLVLVNFWATWCAPCLKEIPLLVEAQDRYASRGLQILGPAMDNPEQVRAMLGRLRIQYPILIGERAVSRAMDALGDTLGALPFSVLISADGQVIQRKHGEYQRAELAELIEAHLPAQPPSP